MRNPPPFYFFTDVTGTDAPNALSISAQVITIHFSVLVTIIIRANRVNLPSKDTDKRKTGFSTSSCN